MWQRGVLVVGGAGLAAALLVFWPAADDAPRWAGAPTPTRTSPQPAGPPAAFDGRGSSDTSAPPLALATPLPGAPPPAGAAAPAQLAVAAPQKLRVGETQELVISLGAHAGVAEVSFTAQFDANVLQVRAGTEGDWAARAGGSARFAADISSAEDRVLIRSQVTGARYAGAGGSVALVQFQAVAQGSTVVMVSDVAVKDAAGNAVPFSLSSSNLQVTAETASTGD